MDILTFQNVDVKSKVGTLGRLWSDFMDEAFEEEGN